MRHNKKQTIRIETSYDVDTLPKIIYRIVARLKWQRYELARINKREQDLNAKRNGVFRTSILPALLGFIALMTIVIPIVVGIKTHNLSSAIISLVIIVGATFGLLLWSDKRDINRRNQLNARRNTVTREVGESLTPDMARLLQVDLPIAPTPIAIDELVRVYRDAQALASIIQTLAVDYKAKTVFSIPRLDMQKLIQNASQYTTAILYEDTNDTMCILAWNDAQTHYYEFNESTKAFDYIPDGILFIKDDDDPSEQ